MLSRVANCLYWMARYIERAENIARIVDVNLQLLLDFRTLNDQRLADPRRVRTRLTDGQRRGGFASGRELATTRRAGDSEEMAHPRSLAHTVNAGNAEPP